MSNAKPAVFDPTSAVHQSRSNLLDAHKAAQLVVSRFYFEKPCTSLNTFNVLRADQFVALTAVPLLLAC